MERQPKFWIRHTRIYSLRIYSLEWYPLYREVTKQFTGSLRICDLGSAGGKNSLNSLHRIIPFLNGREVEYFFEDLPSADINELVTTLDKANLPSNIKARYNNVISTF